MINRDKFMKYLASKFNSDQIFVYKFKPDLWDVEIDCFPDQPYKLTIEVSATDIKLATISKQPSIDFSLYDYIFHNSEEAEAFINKAHSNKEFPMRDIS